MNINEILERASKLKIAVVGDLIQDNYLIGTCDRLSPEAPVPVLLKQSTRKNMGGAGNVFMNLLGLGVDAHLYCNYDGYPFWDMNWINTKIWCNPYPAAKKTRIMCGNHHLLRVDDELTIEELTFHEYKQFSWWEELMNNFSTYDAVVIADYGKGVVSDSVINTLMEYKIIAKDEGKDIPIIVDAKKDFHRYQGVDILKCNNKEVSDNQRWEVSSSVKWLIVTCADDGIDICDRKTIPEKQLISNIPGLPVSIVDVCGAGDTVSAVLAIMSGIGEDIFQSCDLANIAASEVCKYPGVVPITKELLLNRMKA